MSPAEASAAKPGADETGAAKPGAEESGAAKPGADETGADETGAGEASTAKTAAAKTAAAKTAAGKTAPAKAGAAKAGAAKTSTAKTSTAKTSTAKTSTAKTSTVQASAGEASAAATDPAADSGGTAADLPAEIFDAKVNVPLIHQVVVAQEAAARQGTHSTKTRGDVRGGGRKPYRQKGTGRARQGSTRAPQFAGGGVVHGPHPRSYEQRTPKKMKAAALRGALSDRARHGRVHVVGGLVDGDAPRTKDAVAALTALIGVAPGTSPVLVVASASDQVTWKSLRNANGVHLLDSGQLNTRDVLISDHVVFTREALDKFVARATRTAKQEDGQP
jgi:large subunit ribosomal protein L4